MSDPLRITLIYASAPRTVHEAVIDLQAGATVVQALEQSGWLSRFPEIRNQDLALGVWGRKANGYTPLRSGDRIEIYRGLRVDPKVARRERFVGQGARGTGLFTRRRPGSKSGY
ncbi:MAG: RnfH family protein [Hydrogenophaga sp.]|uniref:RnfH family protein n=1 Tax=Hydrogenophaga sp. TaxID=1904254 RepID=UPI002766878A|nr:RnfH family protein [Hydrogenophaga sp.]MDP2418043.1 RnfH family protein [Hydrogenophaga sp.]MDZ4188730.1 RnfH family protein [Hydrogenophaga sp.]